MMESRLKEKCILHINKQTGTFDIDGIPLHFGMSLDELISSLPHFKLISVKNRVAHLAPNGLYWSNHLRVILDDSNGLQELVIHYYPKGSVHKSERFKKEFIWDDSMTILFTDFMEPHDTYKSIISKHGVPRYLDEFDIFIDKMGKTFYFYGDTLVIVSFDFYDKSKDREVYSIWVRKAKEKYKKHCL